MTEFVWIIKDTKQDALHKHFFFACLILEKCLLLMPDFHSSSEQWKDFKRNCNTWGWILVIGNGWTLSPWKNMNLENCNCQTRQWTSLLLPRFVEKINPPLLLQGLLDFFNEHGAYSHLFTIHCNWAALSISRHFNCHQNMCPSRNCTCCKSICGHRFSKGCGPYVSNSCSLLYFWADNFFRSKLARNV